MNQLNVNLPELPYAVSEAMNRLRINIKFCGKNTRKILLTSCQPNEGKSTISSYLWKMLAEAGFPTVLVDVDLRKSVMKTRFQITFRFHHNVYHRLCSGLADQDPADISQLFCNLLHRCLHVHIVLCGLLIGYQEMYVQ